MSLRKPEPHRVTAGFFALQTVALCLFWVSLIAGDATAWFVPSDPRFRYDLRLFLLPDLCIIGASLLAFVGVLRRAHWPRAIAWLLSGCAIYGTLYCIGVSVSSSMAQLAETGSATDLFLSAGSTPSRIHGWLATAMMCAMSVGNLSVASMHSARGEAKTYRAVRIPRAVAVAWTGLQVSIVWFTCLVAFPLGVAEVEHALAVPRFASGGLPALALLAVASTLGLSSGVTMARLGKGTPLPTATASELVIAGPYRFVRNPMALAGIAQGLAVAWWLGSPGFVAACFFAGLSWHFLVRPSEEEDLRARFGQAYESYRAQVRLWIPIPRKRS